MLLDERILEDSGSQYEYIPLSKLRKQFVCISVTGTPASKDTNLPSGATYLFWVVGDGRRTFVYRTSGNAMTVANADFTFGSVVGAAKSMVTNGRIVYLPEKDSAEWVDVGPLSVTAALHTDPDFTTVRKSYLRAELDEAVMMKMAAPYFAKRERWW